MLSNDFQNFSVIENVTLNISMLREWTIRFQMV